MNIFLTSPSPYDCARVLDDSRVVKMALESAQMLSTVARGFHGIPDDTHVYRPTHSYHPCTVWAGRSDANYLWLVDHGLALCDEYSYRFEGRIHKSREIISLCRDYVIEYGSTIPIRDLSFTFNSSGYDTGCVFHDYRLCMAEKWVVKDRNNRRPLKWTRRGPPSWFNTYSEKFRGKS